MVLGISLVAAGAHAQSTRQRFSVPTANGEVRLEGFGNCAKETCPAVAILSGSKGFAAPVYDEIGQTFRAAGLNAYLVHVLSPTDLDAIATAGSARARIHETSNLGVHETGSRPQTFPLPIAQELQRTAQQLGGPVTLDVYKGGTHDFFLRSGIPNADAARRSAAEFLAKHLSESEM